MKHLKKIIALSMSLALLSCTGNSFPILSDMNMPVSAYVYDDTGKLHYGDFDYVILDDGGVEISRYIGSNSSVTIPSRIDGKKVVSIGRNAFNEEKHIKSVIIPTTVESIGMEAFASCDSLTSIRIPGSVKEIGYAAFYNCSSLKTVTIREGVEMIVSNAFRQCDALTKVTIPDSVSFIGSEAFESCDKLEEVTLNGNIETCAFCSCHSLKKVTLKNGCTSIGNEAFKECWALATVKFSDNIEKIGYSCFLNCERLDNVVLPKNLTSLQSSAFRGCKSLKSITLNDKITSIPAYCFYNTPITNIHLPNSVRSIGDDAFYNTPLTSINIPSNLTNIGAAAFANCQEMKSFYLNDKITYIGIAAFANCQNLSFVRLPKNLLRINDSLFSGCTNLATVQTGSGLGEIGSYAFKDCTSLKKLETGKNVYAINDMAFMNCNCTLYGEAGSYAEQFAVRRAIPFVAYLGNKSTVVESDVLMGDIVVFRFDAGGGAGGYKYAVTYKKAADTKYTTLQDYKDTTGYVFEPKQSGVYDFYISVRDAKNTVRKKYFKITVNDPIQNISTIDKTTVNVGESVNITGKVSGGCGNIQYALLNGNYVVKNYSSNSKFTYKFTKSGNYKIVVKAKDSRGMVSVKTFNVTVNYVPPQNMSEISATTVRYGETVKFNLKSQGGNAPYYYMIKYRKKGESEWVTFQNYTTATPKTFKPSRIGDYEIVIKLKDANGNISRKNFDLTVTI